MQVRSAADSAAKFKSRAAAARNDYASGVQGAGARWQAGAEASEDAWAAGTQEAISQKRFGKGVRRAGATRYQENASKLGPDRFVTGVQNADQAYARGVSPYISAMQSTTLPPRGARRSPQNAARIQANNELMARVRMEQLGS